MLKNKKRNNSFIIIEIEKMSDIIDYKNYIKSIKIKQPTYQLLFNIIYNFICSYLSFIKLLFTKSYLCTNLFILNQNKEILYNSKVENNLITNFIFYYYLKK